MSDDNKMDMIYASGKSYGKSMEQAMQLAAKAKELNASIVNIEVKSEETFRLRDENAQLKAQVEQLKGGMNFNYEKNQELVTDNEKLRSLLLRALGALDMSCWCDTSECPACEEREAIEAEMGDLC